MINYRPIIQAALIAAITASTLWLMSMIVMLPNALYEELSVGSVGKGGLSGLLLAAAIQAILSGAVGLVLFLVGGAVALSRPHRTLATGIVCAFVAHIVNCIWLFTILFGFGPWPCRLFVAAAYPTALSVAFIKSRRMMMRASNQGVHDSLASSAS